jgi:hypothetical protein
MVLMAAAMVAVFAGTGQAAVIYANSVDDVLGVNNPGNLTDVQDQHYATFSNGDTATLGFEQNFVDVAGGDAMIYIQGSLDVFLLSGLTLQAHNIIDDSLITLEKKTGVGIEGVGWWFDWTKGYEIPGPGSNLYDQILISYSGRYSIDVDAVRVDTGNGGVAPVPEPGTMMLLGSGLVGVAYWGRKKFRK